ncbi:MAG: nucleotidyltransferase domain-containing protein [Devosia sp.]|nr:nucleotidyltransferase domain-containing protein [Devosia sp.]
MLDGFLFEDDIGAEAHGENMPLAASGPLMVRHGNSWFVSGKGWEGALRSLGLSEKQIEIIRDWAEAEDLIDEVVLYGSRAKGTHREDSDVDLAVHQVGTNEHAVHTFMHFKGEDWQNDLIARTGLKISLAPRAGHLTPKIEEYLGHASFVIFSRDRRPTP